MMDIYDIVNGMNYLKIPRPIDRDYTREELKEILEDLMLKFSRFSINGISGPTISNISPVDQKAPQYLFYLLFKEYLNKLRDEDKEYVWSGIVSNNSHRTQANSLATLVDNYIKSIPSSVPYRSGKLLQHIYYGAPGTGKSYQAKENTKGYKVYRTTFHPDTDYASFVGSYKPVVNENGIVRDSEGQIVAGQKDKTIEYKFVPQVFTNAYLEAWRSMLNDEPPQPVCLLIEELNRGNCAQIFGDLFQLLDRSSGGFSEYSIHAQEDLAAYIKATLGNGFEAYYNRIRENSDLTDNGDKTIPDWDSTNIDNNKLRLCLPPNLSIVCTMNTSDQSLFPMDSAFKRRWDWEYVPIDYECDHSQFKIKIDENLYDWPSFLKTVNDIIYDKTKSEDKQMGNFFVKGDENMEVSCGQFVSKVMYYLWSEICKDNPKAKDSLFIYKTEESDEQEEKNKEKFSFSDLFGSDRNVILNGFMRFLKINPDPDETIEEGLTPADEDRYRKQLQDFLKFLDKDQSVQNQLFKARFEFANRGWNYLYRRLGKKMNGYSLKIAINKTGCYINWYINDSKSVTPELKQQIHEKFGVPTGELEGYSSSGWSRKGDYFKKQHDVSPVNETSYIWIVETVNMIYGYFESLDDHTV